MPAFFPNAKAKNKIITFLSIISSWPLSALATDRVFDYCLLKQGNGATQAVGYWTYNDRGQRQENITDWALEQFKNKYRTSPGKNRRPMTKEAIFHYVYAVLHDPVYREKYALNLKREFPRVPFYTDFWEWSEWGQTLMNLHIGYDKVTRFTLRRTDIPDEEAIKTGHTPRPILKINKQRGCIFIDTETTLSGIPSEAWDYRLANRTAFEWVLDQYREKVPKDRTIREHFNTYHFVEYKEKVIDLLRRVTTVSVETMKIVRAMKTAHRN